MRISTFLFIAVLLFLPEVTSAQDGPLTLEEAVKAALRNNEAAGAAEARTERSEALLREAYGALIPSLQVTGTYTRRDEEIVRNVGGTSAVIQSQNALSANVTARTTLFSAPAIPLVRGAGRAAEAAEFSEENVKRELARNAALAYVAVLAADELVEAAEERVAYAKRTVEDARARAGAGLANKTDVTRAEVEFASAELTLTESRNTAVRATNALSFITALEISRPLTTPTFPPPVSGTAAELSVQALDERHDLKASTLLSEAARFRAQAPWLQYTPSLALEGVYRTTNESGLSGDNDSWYVAAVATWRLYDGGIAAAQARQYGADAKIAELETRQLRRSINVEVDNALADLETARAAVVQAELAARAATELRDEVTQRFSYGLASGLEQADAAVSAFESQAALARRRLELNSAQLRLSAALGHWPAGFHPESQSQK